MEESKKKIIGVAGITLRLIGIFVASYVIYVVLLSFYPYTVGPNSVDEIAQRAAKNNDMKACGKIRTYPFPLFIEGFDITTDGIKQECYFLLARISKDEKVCNYLSAYSPDDSYINRCISEIAILKNDVKVCESISSRIDGREKGDCYESFTRNGTDISVCDNIRLNDGTQNLVKDLCYYGAVEFNPDMSICASKIQEEYWKAQCYFQIARATKNPALCDIFHGNYERYNMEVTECKRYIETR